MTTDDPKFTAYALGELPDEERAEVEALLRENPAALDELEQLRDFTANLRAELQAQPGDALSEEQRVAVLAAAAPKVIAFPWWRTTWVQSAAAAVLVAVSAGFVVWGPPGDGPAVATAPTRRAVEITRDGVALRLAPAAEAAAEPAPAPSPIDSERHAYVAKALPPAAGGPAQPLARQSTATAPAHDALKIVTPPPSGTAAFAMKSGDGTLFIEHAESAATRNGIEITGRELKLADSYSAGGNVFRGLPAESKPRPAKVPASSSLNGGTLASAPKSADRTRYADGTYASARTQAVFDPASPAKPAATAAAPNEPLSKADVVALAAADKPGYFNRAITPQERARIAGENQDIGHFNRPLKLLQDEPSDTEAYDAITDNAFLAVAGNPLSTFSIDVDTASYANVRRFLNTNTRPPRGAVRIEELVNYFRYDYPAPEGDEPFAVQTELGACPWQPEHHLLRIGLKGREVSRQARPQANLVFLIDVSGSMDEPDKLPLVQQSLALLVDQLEPRDRVAIAVYAGASGCVLEPTHDRAEIRAALERLKAGGSTNGAAGLRLAYDLAKRNFRKGAINRVILCTDGDFNVGMTNQGELVRFIEDRRKSGVFLSVFGFGMGNLKDSTLEKLADKGNGSYGYIDSIAEGRRVFVQQMSGTLVTIAKDVKLQLEFNPAQVAAYRLIGYENRVLAKEDFNDDTKDAGEIGAGHTVTALYELIPAGKAVPGATLAVDPLKYESGDNEEARARNPESKISNELLTVKLRWKAPEADESVKREFALSAGAKPWENTSRDFRWAASVASFGMLLRDSPHKGGASWGATLEWAREGRGEDALGERTEFVSLIEKARALSR